jgi:uncharacterized protein YqeY
LDSNIYSLAVIYSSKVEKVIFFLAHEIEILNTYLPQPLSAEEISALVQSAIAEAGATSRKEMGAVMKIVNEKAAGRADGRTISAEVQKHLPA